MNDIERLLKKGMEFIVIPNEMFYIKGECGYFMELEDYNIIMVLLYFQTKKDFIDDVSFTLSDIIKYCGLKPLKGEGKSIDKMKTLLNMLKDRGIIICDIDFNNVKVNDFIRVTFNINEVLNNSFTKIPLKVIDKISNINIKDFRKVLTLWCYLHCRRYKKSSIGDGKESATQVSYNTIYRDTGISNDSINKYLDVLVDNGLLLKHNSGYLIKDKKCENCNNIYVTVDDTMEIAQGFIHEAISRYEYEKHKQGYTISKCTAEERRERKKNRPKTSYDKGYEKEQYNSLFEPVNEQEQETTNMLMDLF